MKSRYGLMERSNTKAQDETFYPDVCTFPIQKFKLTSNPKEYAVTSIEVQRPDLIVWFNYDLNEFDDILLWLNGISDVRNMIAGDIILIPTRTDMEDFYLRYRV